MKHAIENLIVKTNSLKFLSFVGFVYGLMVPSKRSFSQYGEDLIIENFFKSIGVNSEGFYLDIGAYHPKFISNTYKLHKSGWRGVCIDLCDEKLKWFRYMRKKKVSTICSAITPDDTNGEITVFKHKRILSEIDTIDENVAKKNKKEILITL